MIRPLMVDRADRRTALHPVRMRNRCMTARPSNERCSISRSRQTLRHNLRAIRWPSRIPTPLHQSRVSPPIQRPTQPISRSRRPSKATADTVERPGQSAQDAAGQGENSDPRDGSGQQSIGPQTPKDVEGSEATQNPDTGPLDKQAGMGDEGTAGSGESSDSAEGTPSSQGQRDRDKSPGPNRDKVRNPTIRRRKTEHEQHQSDSQGEWRRREWRWRTGGVNRQISRRDSPAATCRPSKECRVA